MKLRIKSMIWNIRKQKPTSQNKKKKKESDDSIKSLWDNFEKPNICIIGVPEGENKEQEIGIQPEKIMK